MRFASRCPPAVSAARICTWSTANCRTAYSRSFRATRSSAGSTRSGGRRGSARSASGSAFRGSATPAASVPIAVMRPENLCDHPLFTGYTRDGGYATATIADARFAFPLGEAGERCVPRAAAVCRLDRLAVAGDRRRGQEAGALRLRRRGPYSGAGGAMAGPIGVRLHAARRSRRHRRSRASLGAAWAGGSDETPPEPLDAAIIFAPVGDLVPRALKAVRKGGRVVCAGIHMSDIPSFPVPDPLGGARASVGRQSYAPGRHRFPRPGAADRHRHQDHALSARTSQPGARRPARRTIRGRRSSRTLGLARSNRVQVAMFACPRSARSAPHNQSRCMRQLFCRVLIWSSSHHCSKQGPQQMKSSAAEPNPFIG